MIKAGKIKVDDEVDIVGMHSGALRSKVLAIESFDKIMTQAEAGDSVQICLRGMTHHSVTRGHTAAARGSLFANRRFTADTYVLKPEEGGRNHSFSSNFRPQVNRNYGSCSALSNVQMWP